jgi:enamine deaminase RidA (YjgF/YER057c/UK114 family)
MERAYDQFHFAPAVRSGKWLRCSGQLGTDAKFQVIVEPEAQFAQAFENAKSVLAAAKLDFRDVVEMTTFHVGLRDHLGTFMKVKDRYLAAPYPAWTAIGVSGLALPGPRRVRATARLRAEAGTAARREPEARQAGAKTPWVGSPRDASRAIASARRSRSPATSLGNVAPSTRRPRGGKVQVLVFPESR